METIYHQPYFVDPQLELLIERIYPPRVCIDNDTFQDCTLVKVDSANKHGILLEMVQVLTDLDLVISKSYISSDGGWFMDVFHVTDQFGNKLTDESLIHYIKQALCASRKEGSPRKVRMCNTGKELLSPEHTAAEITGIDRPGLLSEIFAVLVELGCNVTAAVAWTHHKKAASIIYIEEGWNGGMIKDSKRLAHVQEQLENVVDAHNGQGETSSVKLTAPSAGWTHPERRLHQLMYANGDYEQCRCHDDSKSCKLNMKVLRAISTLLLLGGVHQVATLSIDASAEVVATRPEIEVEFDLDPESKAQWGGIGASRSDRPVFEGRSKFPDGEPMGINIRPLAAKKTTSSLSTVLKPEGFNFGRGTAYVASEDVAEGDELLSLPMSQVMTVNSAARGRVGLLLEVNPDLPPVITLSLHLLEERALGPFSNFSNFVSMLPAIGDINSTMFYSEDQLKELEGSQLLLHTLGRAQAAEAFYDALLKPVTSREAVDPPIFKEQDFTLENFRWALGVVWATAFQTGENETDVVLAPILDTIGICTEEGNESCLPPRITVDSNERLVVYASSTYTKGQEVRLSMPGKSSVQLMLNHGFARAEAVPKLDKMDLTVTLDPSDPLAPMKGYLLQTQLNESVNTTYAFFYGTTEIDEAIATSLKMKLLSGVELPRYKELLAPKEENDQERRILSLHNEFVFTRAIISTCTTLLGYYPTTIEQDEGIVADLTGKNDFQSIQKIHVQRTLMMEKQILKKTMDIALEDWKNLVFSSSPSLQD